MKAMFLLLLVLLCSQLLVHGITDEGSLTRCDREQDCRKYITYCKGPYICNMSAYCSIKDARYDPCRELRRHVRAFTSTTRESSPLSILCVEEIRACVELYYCLTNDDCDCTHGEECREGQCKPSATTTTCSSLLHGASSLGVYSSSEEPADPTTTYVIVIGVTVFVVVGVFFALTLMCGWAGSNGYSNDRGVYG